MEIVQPRKPHRFFLLEPYFRVQNLVNKNGLPQNRQRLGIQMISKFQVSDTIILSRLKGDSYTLLWKNLIYVGNKLQINWVWCDIARRKPEFYRIKNLEYVKETDIVKLPLYIRPCKQRVLRNHCCLSIFHCLS